jgi:hypothetical protein
VARARYGGEVTRSNQPAVQRIVSDGHRLLNRQMPAQVDDGASDRGGWKIGDEGALP